MSLSLRCAARAPEGVSVASAARTRTGVGVAVFAVFGLKRSWSEWWVGKRDTHRLGQRSITLAMLGQLLLPLSSTGDRAVLEDVWVGDGEVAESSDDFSVVDGGHGGILLAWLV